MTPILEALTPADLAELVTCPTTGLVTRPAGALWAGRVAAPAWGVVMIDLDGLKAVNDTAGHGAGDALLRLAAEVVRAVVRTDDAVTVRWGGDEIVVLLPGAVDVAPVAARLTDALDGRLSVRASVGAAVGDRLAEVIARADEEMYEAKLARR